MRAVAAGPGVSGWAWRPGLWRVVFVAAAMLARSAHQRGLSYLIDGPALGRLGLNAAGKIGRDTRPRR